MNPYIKNVLVLTLITVIAGFALALTYTLTKDRIAESERQEVLKSIRFVMPTDERGNSIFTNAPDQMQVSYDIKDSQTGTDKRIIFFPGLDDSGNLIGLAVQTSSKIGYGGDLGVMIGIDLDGTILEVYILSMLETPGLGTKVNEKPFKSQFCGKSLSKNTIILKKDNKEKGDIDAVTGATISSRAITTAINEALKFYSDHKEEIIEKVKSIRTNAPSGSITSDQGGK
jgi:electron transport complex protein RnfG